MKVSYIKLFLIAFFIILILVTIKHFTKDKIVMPEVNITSDQLVHPAIEAHNDIIKIDNKDVNVNFLIINLSNSGLKLGISSPHIFEGNDRSSYNGFSLSEYMRLGAYEVAQSGGFMSSFSPPNSLGYLKIRGNEYNQIHNSWLTTGVLCTNGKDYDIFKYESKEQLEKWVSCIQAGPILIKERKIVLDKNRNTGFIAKENHRQSFLCELSDKRLVMGIAENVRLDRLVNYLSQPKVSDGLECVDAVALNGKNIAGLLYKTKSGINKFGNSEAPLPNSIVIK